MVFNFSNQCFSTFQFFPLQFRHVFGAEKKREFCYEGIQCAASAPDPQHIKANPKYFAVPWRGGGGAILVHKWEDVGKISGIPPLICGHTNEIVDSDFHPFNDDLIATASEVLMFLIFFLVEIKILSQDTTLKIWRIPDGGVTENITEAAVTLNGHRKKLSLCLFNPVADNLLASVGFDFTVRLWDVEKGDEKQCLEGDHPDSIHSIDWNYNGSLFSTTCRDKNIRIFDPRSGTCVSKFQGHMGAKGSKAFWMGTKDKLGSVGFSKNADRQLAFYDPRDTSKPLAMNDLDQSSGTLMPFYDNDTSLLFLAGKGDANIRYFEIVDEAPWQFFISAFSNKEAQRGACMLPKRANDVAQNEVVRIIKLTTDRVEPVSFTVPRKGDQFQDDLFPDCYAGVPSLTCSEWLEGKNANPRLKSMKPGDFTVRAADVSAGGPAVVKREGAAAVSSPLPPSPKVAGGADAAKVAALEAENSNLKTKVAELEAKVAELEAALAESAIKD